MSAPMDTVSATIELLVGLGCVAIGAIGLRGHRHTGARSGTPGARIVGAILIVAGVVAVVHAAMSFI
jgi:hypothetical protein